MVALIRLGALVMSVAAVAAVPSVGAPRVPVSVDAQAGTASLTDPGRTASTPRVTCWAVPVDADVADPFRAPECRWCPGNRGIEYASVAGDAVRAVVGGQVTFDGSVAGRRYLSIDIVVSGGRLRVTYGGLDPAGERFVVGQTVGREQPLGSATGPVHLGVRWNGEYIDPADFTDGPPRRARLVPVEGTPGRAAERRGACG